MKSLFKSLKVQINVFIVALIICSFVVFSLTFIISEKNRLSKELVQNGQVFASFSTQVIYDNFVTYYTHNTDEDFSNFQDNVEAILGNNTDVIKVSLVGVNGRILFDSEEFKTGKYVGESRSITDEETLAMIQKEEISSREIVLNNQKITEIVNPIKQGGSHIFSVTYVLSHNSLSDRMKEVYIQILMVTIPLLILISILTYLFVSAIVKPLNLLTIAVKKIREGDLESKIDIKNKDEIGELGLAFNEMTVKLKESYTILETKIKERTKELETERGSLESKVGERTKELEELKNNLEKTVLERTEKLNSQLEEMEQMNKLMTGRELKMMELKKEIEELQGKLGAKVS